jgi:hypothetical protein
LNAFIAGRAVPAQQRQGPPRAFGLDPLLSKKFRSAGDPFFALVRTCARRHRADTPHFDHELGSVLANQELDGAIESVAKIDLLAIAGATKIDHDLQAISYASIRETSCGVSRHAHETRLFHVT